MEAKRCSCILQLTGDRTRVLITKPPSTNDLLGPRICVPQECGQSLGQLEGPRLAQVTKFMEYVEYVLFFIRYIIYIYLDTLCTGYFETLGLVEWQWGGRQWGRASQPAGEKSSLPLPLRQFRPGQRTI